MKKLTIFTPTFNRARLLPRLYQSLLAQTCTNFVWLVIDDGSTDGTAALVDGWRASGPLDIEYRYKPNGGMHTAHNLAYATMRTELNVCVDSDDWLPARAVETILHRWASVRGDASVAGILGLDADADRRVIGTRLPKDGTRSTLAALYGKLGVRGDKKVVYRTDVVQRFPPYPVFANEKLVPLAWLSRLIDQQYRLACFNDVYTIVEYQPDGSSSTVLKQYFESPCGFAEWRKLCIEFPASRRERLWAAIHLEACRHILGLRLGCAQSPMPALSRLCVPFGWLLYGYLRWRKWHAA